MILVDSNVPMYIIGMPHPHKPVARHLTERLLADGERLVTDAEAFQEILRRYVSIGRHVDIQLAFDVLRGITDEIFPVEEADVLRAKEIVLGSPALSARDAVHLAVMERHGIETILSFDRGFDEVPGIRRIGG